MAEFVDISVVPWRQVENFQLGIDEVDNPFDPGWWTAQNTVGVSEQVMGWLVSNGWRVTEVTPDATTVPPTLYYSLTKPVLSSELTLLKLCNSYTTAANDALFANQQRYNEVVGDWRWMIAYTHTHFEAQIAQHNTDVGVYITDLGTFMTELDGGAEAAEGLIAKNIDRLESELFSHEEESRKLLDDLGVTERKRIDEDYTAKLSVLQQDLIDRGLYTSLVALDITERNHRNRDEQIQLHNDRLMREKLANEHQIYGQEENMAGHRHRAIVEKMNTAVARLDGWKSVAADNRQLMAYQLDEQNKLAIGLYSFVERRTDIAPEWKDMASMIAGLGDAAGGWIQP